MAASNLLSQLNREDCLYQQYYCEENVCQLCARLESTPQAKSCFAVFISNEGRKVPLWCQRAGQSDNEGVIWDYHVVLLDAVNSCVYDVDCNLPLFPCPLQLYVTQAIRPNSNLKPDYHRKLRLISAENVLKYFSSDRRHMKKLNGDWLQPPPDWPCFWHAELGHNLDEFLTFDKVDGSLIDSVSEVLDSDVLIGWVQEYNKTV